MQLYKTPDRGMVGAQSPRDPQAPKVKSGQFFEAAQGTDALHGPIQDQPQHRLGRMRRSSTGPIPCPSKGSQFCACSSSRIASASRLPMAGEIIAETNPAHEPLPRTGTLKNHTAAWLGLPRIRGDQLPTGKQVELVAGVDRNHGALNGHRRWLLPPELGSPEFNPLQDPFATPSPGTWPAGREPHLWTLGVPDWLGTGHSLMRFAPPSSAILKDLPRSPHPTSSAQPTRLASSQVRSPKQR